MALLSSRGTVGDEVCGLIKQVGLNPRIVNAFYPWGGGFNIFFEPKDQVVEAWQKSGEASDEFHAHLTEKNRTLENKIKELEDTNHELKEQLEFFEVKFEEAAKEKDPIKALKVVIQMVTRTQKGTKVSALVMQAAESARARQASEAPFVT